MAKAAGLSFCLDECLGALLPEMLRRLRAPASPSIHGLKELGLASVSDEVMLAELARLAVGTLVTADSKILAASIRREVWRASGVGLFVLDGKWGNVKLFERARHLLWWWPHIVSQSLASPAGSAWKIPLALKDGAMAELFPRDGRSE